MYGGQQPPEQYQMQAMGTQGYYREERGGSYDNGDGYDDDDRRGGPNDSYQKYTEGGGGKQIDTDSGIAPRGLTDCIVIWIFLAYVLGMVVIVTYTKTLRIGSHAYGDIARLSHAMDEQARLCGSANHEEVKDKPYLFYCRTGRRDESNNLLMMEEAVPLSLNLDHPTCVKTCPTDFGTSIACLYAHQVEVYTMPGNQFGNVKTFHLTAQQNVVETSSYETFAFGGRYCVPKDSDLKATILGLKGPMNPLWRLRNQTASFEKPWLVLFLCSILAVVLGYLYLFALKGPAMCMVGTFLVISSIFAFIGSCCFLFVGIIGFVEKYAGMDLADFQHLKEMNPLYGRFTTLGASVLSVLFALVLLCILFVQLFVFSNQVAHFQPNRNKQGLLKVAFEVVLAMRSLAITPLVLAAAKFIACMVLAYNFMYLASVGHYEDRRIQVNGELYMGADKKFKFDWGILPWMLYYLYGWVWIMEIINAIGHFLISFSVVSWYFIRKDDDGMKTGVPNMPIWMGTQAMVKYHMGSVILGAAMVPMYRPFRLLNWPVFPETQVLPNAAPQCKTCKFPEPPDPQGTCLYTLLTFFSDFGEGALTRCRACCCLAKCCKARLKEDKDPEATDGHSWLFVGSIAFIGFAVFKVFAPALVAPSVATSGAVMVLLVLMVLVKFWPALTADWASYRFTKDAYADVIIRSSHYWESSAHVLKIIANRPSCNEQVQKGKGLQVVTISGASTIGMVCSAFCYLLLMTMHNLEDPNNTDYIADPMAVCFLCFLLCGPCIGYGFTMLVDHTFDTVLYCYAFNKRYYKNSGGSPVDDFLPDSMKDVVNIDKEDDDIPYGNARPNMYLNTFMPTGWFPSKKDSSRGQTPSATLSMGGASGSRTTPPGGTYRR